MPKPKMSIDIDAKPKMKDTMQPIEQEKFYTVTVNAGQWMGFLNFTYPETFTVTTNKSGE